MKTKSACGALLVVALMALGGCASPARVEMMQVQTSAATRTAMANSQMREAIALGEVSGGRDTKRNGVPSVAGRDFGRALEASLKSAGLLTPEGQTSRYLLVANLSYLNQPAFGFNMTVTAAVHYSLVERSTNRVVFARVISKPYTAAMGEAFAGVERLKLANEGAIRVNIQELIGALAAVNVASAEVKLAQ